MNKYTDHTPNRTTRQIREDMALIQSIRPHSVGNRRRYQHRLNVYAIAAATFAAVCIIVAARG